MLGKVARKIGGSWYDGTQFRANDAQQAFAVAEEKEERSTDFKVDASIHSVGLGALAEYDSRDMPINSYAQTAVLRPARFPYCRANTNRVDGCEAERVLVSVQLNSHNRRRSECEYDVGLGVFRLFGAVTRDARARWHVGVLPRTDIVSRRRWWHPTKKA